MRLRTPAYVSMILWGSSPRALKRVLSVRIANERERHIVDLNVGAAERRKIRDFGGPGGDGVVPELFDVGINRLVDGSAASPEVQHARRRNADLRRAVRLLLQEREVLGENAFHPPELACHAHEMAWELLDRRVGLKRQRRGDGLVRVDPLNTGA